MSGPKCARYHVAPATRAQIRARAVAELRRINRDLTRDHAALRAKWAKLVQEAASHGIQIPAPPVLRDPPTSDDSEVLNEWSVAAIRQSQRDLREFHLLEQTTSRQIAKKREEEERRKTRERQAMIDKGAADRVEAGAGSADASEVLRKHDEDRQRDEAAELQRVIDATTGQLHEQATVDDVARVEDFVRRNHSEGTVGRSGELALMISAINQACTAAIENGERLDGLRSSLVLEVDESEARQRLLEEIDACDPRLATAADLQRIATEVEDLVQQAAAARERAYVLEQTRAALEELGYEVPEDFTQTILAQPARGVVAARVDSPGYGVCIRSTTAGELRFGVVGARGRAGDGERDKEVETDWCSDYRELTEMIGAQGIELALDPARSYAPGERKLEEVNEIPGGGQAARRRRRRRGNQRAGGGGR